VIAALRSHLAAFWGNPYGKWVTCLVAAVFALFIVLYLIIAAFIALPLLFGLGLVWLVMFAGSLRSSWQEAQALSTYRPFWLKGVAIPLGALVAGVALLWPALFLGSRLKSYIILAANYASYQNAASAELAKPRPRLLSWDYDGFLDNGIAIVWDSTRQPAKRLIKEEGAYSATCFHLIGYYYDCGIDN